MQLTRNGTPRIRHLLHLGLLIWLSLVTLITGITLQGYTSRRHASSVETAVQPDRSSSVSAVASSGGSQPASQAIVFNAWSSHGPWGGDVNCLAIDPSNPSIIYVGPNSNGVFKSINGGASWSPSNNGLTATTVLALVMDPINANTIYVGLFLAVYLRAPMAVQAGVDLIMA